MNAARIVSEWALILAKLLPTNPIEINCRVICIIDIIWMIVICMLLGHIKLDKIDIVCTLSIHCLDWWIRMLLFISKMHKSKFWNYFDKIWLVSGGLHRMGVKDNYIFFSLKIGKYYFLRNFRIILKINIYSFKKMARLQMLKTGN